MEHEVFIIMLTLRALYLCLRDIKRHLIVNKYVNNFDYKTIVSDTNSNLSQLVQFNFGFLVELSLNLKIS